MHAYHLVEAAEQSTGSASPSHNWWQAHRGREDNVDHVACTEMHDGMGTKL